MTGGPVFNEKIVTCLMDKLLMVKKYHISEILSETQIFSDFTIKMAMYMQRELIFNYCIIPTKITITFDMK